MSSHGLRTPLLVWIDDCPENIAYEVGKAEKLGIMVIQLSSTAIAKAWVEENLGMDKTECIIRILVDLQITTFIIISIHTRQRQPIPSAICLGQRAAGKHTGGDRILPQSYGWAEFPPVHTRSIHRGPCSHLY